MKIVQCLSCAYLDFNVSLEKWECTRPGWRHYIDDPSALIKCNFYKRKKEEKAKALTFLKVRAPNSGKH
jgi:hypothetical protein